MMTFKEYLIKKNIDEKAFEKGNHVLFSELKTLFEQVHPDSFTMQKMFLINKIRRAYILNKKE